METEAQLIVQRASLRWLAQQHPSWTHQELAIALGKSLAWVKKWLKRLHEAAPGDVMALHARSRERLTPPASLTSQTAVVQRILEIGESPPENLHRIPGPEAILYYLHRDPELQKAGVRLPRSQTTVWKILRLFGCIVQEHRRKPRPLERKQPGEEVQLDLKDATTVPTDPDGKRKPGGGNHQFRGCRHLDLVEPQRWGRLRRRKLAGGRGAVFARIWFARHAHL
jgi:hypothetical protein